MTNPATHYDIDIRRDGTWYYQGTPIRRPALVKLFSTVLQRDAGGAYWLVTPAERGQITVEDSPFLAVEVRSAGEGLAQELFLRTNMDEWVAVGPDHPLRFSFCPAYGAAVPYVLVRGGLEARVVRPVYYALAALMVESPTEKGLYGLWSKGRFYALDNERNGERAA